MSAGEAILNVGLAVLNVVGIGATLKLAAPRDADDRGDIAHAQPRRCAASPG